MIFCGKDFRAHLPADLLDPNPNDADGANDLPLLEGKTLVKDRPAAYVCENYPCKAPVTEPSQLGLALGLRPWFRPAGAIRPAVGPL